MAKQRCPDCKQEQELVWCVDCGARLCKTCMQKHLELFVPSLKVSDATRADVRNMIQRIEEREAREELAAAAAARLAAFCAPAPDPTYVETAVDEVLAEIDDAALDAFLPASVRRGATSDA